MESADSMIGSEVELTSTGEAGAGSSDGDGITSGSSKIGTQLRPTI